MECDETYETQVLKGCYLLSSYIVATLQVQQLFLTLLVSLSVGILLGFFTLFVLFCFQGRKRGLAHGKEEEPEEPPETKPCGTSNNESYPKVSVLQQFLRRVVSQIWKFSTRCQICFPAVWKFSINKSTSLNTSLNRKKIRQRSRPALRWRVHRAQSHVSNCSTVQFNVQNFFLLTWPTMGRSLWRCIYSLGHNWLQQCLEFGLHSRLGHLWIGRAPRKGFKTWWSRCSPARSFVMMMHPSSNWKSPWFTPRNSASKVPKGLRSVRSLLKGWHRWSTHQALLVHQKVWCTHTAAWHIPPTSSRSSVKYLLHAGSCRRHPTFGRCFAMRSTLHCAEEDSSFTQNHIGPAIQYILQKSSPPIQSLCWLQAQLRD